MVFVCIRDIPTVEHWADRHIRYMPFVGHLSWVAYDETGDVHGRYPTQSEARQALIAYGDTL